MFLLRKKKVNQKEMNMSYSDKDSQSDSESYDCENVQSSKSCDKNFSEFNSFDYKGYSLTSGGAISLETVAVLFKDFCKSPDANHDADNKAHSSNTATSVSLDSIDENSEYTDDKYFDERKVTISTVIVPHNGDYCAKYVASRLHNLITESSNFSSVANFPMVLRDAFWNVDTEYLNHLASINSNDDSGCSVITAIITYNNEVAIAHVGDVRAVIRGVDGKCIPLSSAHIIAHSEEERLRLHAVGVDVNDESKINGKIPISRAIGFQSYKKVTREGILSYPFVAQLQIKLNKKDSMKVSPSDGNRKGSAVTSSKQYALVIGYTSNWTSSNDRKLVTAMMNSVDNDEKKINGELAEFIKEGSDQQKIKKSLFGFSKNSDKEITSGFWAAVWSR